jgi:hypothetical protein
MWYFCSINQESVTLRHRPYPDAIYLREITEAMIEKVLPKTSPELLCEIELPLCLDSVGMMSNRTELRRMFLYLSQKNLECGMLFFMN